MTTMTAIAHTLRDDTAALRAAGAIRMWSSIELCLADLDAAIGRMADTDTDEAFRVQAIDAARYVYGIGDRRYVALAAG